MIGDHQLLVKNCSVTGRPQVVAGPADPAGTFRSAGSVRAKAGTPVDGVPDDSLDVGFAFDANGDTGIFLSSDGELVTSRPHLLRMGWPHL